MMRLALAFALALGAALPARAAVDVQEVTSPDGIDAWLVEDHTIPFTALEIRFRGGTALDRPGKGGAVNLMTALIEEGAADRDAQAFALAREELAASYSFDANDDAISVSARFLTENRDAAVNLLRDALVEPRFDQDAVDRVRDQVLSIIASDLNDPGAIASRAFMDEAFPDHPYSAPNNGTAESVTDLTREDIVEAHRDTFVTDRVYVGAVGDITPEALGELLDDLLGDLPRTGGDLPGEAVYSAEPGVDIIEFDTPQSMILFGHKGIARDDPDFMAAYILNEMFGGGGFNSRLMEEVRVERGLTYGIGTWLQPMENGALLMGQAASANASTAETVEVVSDEWARVAEGVSEEELAEIKTYLTGAYPLRFDGNSTIASILVGMQMDDLGIDYIETRNDQIEAVTLDDIARVAERIYRPDDLSFTIVGQPDGIEATN
ncbi:pitrilysin family protein [Palleronia sp. LCG004]|uniref:M16 family metallopeptidase n=1 Tax=Palleronia sp. LCG004 TaxID=3079304 RepID=UPI002941D547|nr:pitrilysin family protein [Palleronia sp. LCG004]WOI55436.1 pitrilysin family protein [Palleronia sp. LCG004]